MYLHKSLGAAETAMREALQTVQRHFPGCVDRRVRASSGTASSW